MTADTGTKPYEELPITNGMRLSLRQWAVTLAIVTIVAVATPRIWRHVERFQTGPDYRIPFQLSNDYWLLDWRLQKTAVGAPIIVLGDSVVWGEYVKADGTLPHFLNRQAGQPNRFVNAGVSGLFPLAMEGLVRNYGASLHDRKVIVVCNLLWLSSPKADMQSKKAESINHAVLVPQYLPDIPCYQVDQNDRLGNLVQRNVDFFGWVSHLQDCYFQQKSIPNWTLAEDADNRSNACKNPLAQITLDVPSGVSDDADRGPGSPRHRPWMAGDARKQPLAWVSLESSLQWAAFRRTIALLQQRRNDVLVIVAPFNKHMIAGKGRAGYTSIHDGAIQWFRENGVPCVAPNELPSELYADASHPLTAGYESLAKSIFQAEAFQKWIEAK
jgi:hypothetical protein